MKSDDAVSRVLAGSNLTLLMSMSCNAMENFLKSFSAYVQRNSGDNVAAMSSNSKSDFPEESCDEVLFINCVIGCLTNISARDAGREGLFENRRLGKLVQCLIRILGQIFLSYNVNRLLNV